MKKRTRDAANENRNKAPEVSTTSDEEEDQGCSE